MKGEGVPYRTYAPHFTYRAPLSLAPSCGVSCGVSVGWWTRYSVSRSGAVYAGLTQDGMPLIGPVDDVEGLFISCGHTYVAPKQTRARSLLR